MIATSDFLYKVFLWHGSCNKPRFMNMLSQCTSLNHFPQSIHISSDHRTSIALQKLLLLTLLSFLLLLLLQIVIIILTSSNLIMLSLLTAVIYCYAYYHYYWNCYNNFCAVLFCFLFLFILFILSCNIFYFYFFVCRCWFIIIAIISVVNFPMPLVNLWLVKHWLPVVR